MSEKQEEFLFTKEMFEVMDLMERSRYEEVELNSEQKKTFEKISLIFNDLILFYVRSLKKSLRQYNLCELIVKLERAEYSNICGGFVSEITCKNKLAKTVIKEVMFFEIRLNSDFLQLDLSIDSEDSKKLTEIVSLCFISEYPEKILQDLEARIENVFQFSKNRTYVYQYKIRIPPQNCVKISLDDFITLLDIIEKKAFFIILLLQSKIPVFDTEAYQIPYSIIECKYDTGFEEKDLERWVKIIQRKKQVIFQGPPGTGKTFIAQKIAKLLIGGTQGFSELVQFHPAYTYEDFMLGIRPQTQDGQLTYSMVPGRFLEFCKKAESCEGTCVLIIDEINRANLSQVFGELMYLLEYRDEKICLAGSNELFGIPANVYIIGTMNTADRSIALVDHALRRRFSFITLSPNYDILRHYHSSSSSSESFIEKLIGILTDLNKTINAPHHELGISFFLVDDLENNIEDIWTMEIEPYLEEYFYDNLDKIKNFRWSEIDKKLLN